MAMVIHLFFNRFRVAAIDHGMISFADVSHNEWPIIVVTNPKNAMFLAPDIEPIENIATSTHVR